MGGNSVCLLPTRQLASAPTIEFSTVRSDLIRHHPFSSPSCLLAGLLHGPVPPDLLHVRILGVSRTRYS